MSLGAASSPRLVDHLDIARVSVAGNLCGRFGRFLAAAAAGCECKNAAIKQEDSAGLAWHAR